MTDDASQFVSRYEWERLVRRARINPMSKYIGMVLAQYTSKDGTGAFPSVAKLALVTGLSERTVRKGLSDMRGLGLIVRDRKGGLRGMQSYSDMHHLEIPSDLLERVEMLTPSEEEGTPKRQEVPPGNDPNRHVVPPQPAAGAAQPASDDTPTGTTCLLPISTYQASGPNQDQPSGPDPTQLTTAREDVTPSEGAVFADSQLLAKLQAFDELAAARRKKAAS